MLWCMVDARFGTCVGAWLMHGLVKLWCMVDAQFGRGCWCMVHAKFVIGVGAWWMHLVWYRLWYTIDVFLWYRLIGWYMLGRGMCW
jgi:hypothetical protein